MSARSRSLGCLAWLFLGVGLVIFAAIAFSQTGPARVIDGDTTGDPGPVTCTLKDTDQKGEQQLMAIERITDRAAIESIIRSEIGRDLEDYTESDFDEACLILTREGWQFIALSPCTCTNYSEDVGHSPSCGWYPIETKELVSKVYRL